MARNFRIQTSGSERTFFFDLIGDFDGSSAFELLNILQEKILNRNQKAYVNTSHLKSIHPFGRDVFTRNFSSMNNSRNVIFTGNHASEIAPPVKVPPRSRHQDARNEISFIDRRSIRKNRNGRASAGGE